MYDFQWTEQTIQNNMQNAIVLEYKRFLSFVQWRIFGLLQLITQASKVWILLLYEISLLLWNFESQRVLKLFEKRSLWRNQSKQTSKYCFHFLQFVLDTRHNWNKVRQAFLKFMSEISDFIDIGTFYKNYMILLLWNIWLFWSALFMYIYGVFVSFLNSFVTLL